MTILIVGGEPKAALELLLALRREGHSTEWIGSFDEMDLVRNVASIELLVVDLASIRDDEISLINSYCRRHAGLPVLGLSVGPLMQGDLDSIDVMSKAVTSDELLVHVRRYIPTSARKPKLRHGELQMDREERLAFMGTRRILLAPREFDILLRFMSEPYRVFSRADLVADLDNGAAVLSDNAVDVHVHRIREKIGRDKILNIRGRGFRLAGVAEAR